MQNRISKTEENYFKIQLICFVIKIHVQSKQFIFKERRLMIACILCLDLFAKEIKPMKTVDLL